MYSNQLDARRLLIGKQQGYKPNLDFTQKIEKMLGVSTEAVHAMRESYHADDALSKSKRDAQTASIQGRPIFAVLQEEEQLPSTVRRFLYFSCTSRPDTVSI